MKFLLIGSGGRERALAWKLSKSPRVTEIHCAPGNPGIGKHAKLVPLAVDDFDGLIKYAKANAIDLTVVGPEDPLAAGIVDRFAEAGLKIFGPSREAARIESDKAFAKDLMRQYKIPTADARIFERKTSTLDVPVTDQAADAVTYIRSRQDPPVIKAAGLAKGKGVIVSASHDEAVKAVHDIMDKRIFGAAGDKVVIEDKLNGEEVSLLAVTDGTNIYVLEACQDHKAVFDGDKGPNTGGMGAYCPAPVLNDKLLAEIERTILVPIVHGLKTEGCPYKGVLYAGLMITRGGPKVLEFNARFGDPETQPLMMRLKSDLAELLMATVDGRLDQINLEWDSRPAVCVVMCSKGYPGDYPVGKPIQGLSRVSPADDLMVFHSGTAVKDDWLVTAGGRVLGVTAMGETVPDAQRRAYETVRMIGFDGAHYRTDIGAKAIARRDKALTEERTMSGNVGTDGQALPHVVIIGGGFGGLSAAQALARQPVRITLIDKRNHHLFQPLLYQVATAALSPADIASPIRSILRRQRNCCVLMAEAKSIDAARKTVVLSDGELPYDRLVIAAGASHGYFGHDEWAALAPGLKTLEDAVEIRRRILLAFEAAERATDPAVRDALLTFVIIGGGPTGVELAGALSEIARTSLARDFRNIDPSTAKVILLEAGPRVLATFPENLSAAAKAYLERLGVEVRTGHPVTGIEPGLVRLKDATIPAHTVLWAAGVVANPLAKSLGVPLDRAGRVLVKPDLTVPGHPEIAVIGDLASLTDPDTKRPVPGVAQGAIQMGKLAAANILRAIKGDLPAEFRYYDKGNLAVIGRGRAVADLGWTTVRGLFAWLIWALVHILFLIGFRNRFLVMIQWIWQYLTFQSGARLITESGGDEHVIERIKAMTAIARAPAPAPAKPPESPAAPMPSTTVSATPGS